MHASAKTLMATAAAVCALVFASVGIGQPARPAAATQAQPASASARAGGAPPNLTGMWRPAPRGGGGNGSFQVIAGAGQSEGGGSETALATRHGNIDYVEIDAEFMGKANQDMPRYKPEHWAKVRELEEFAYRRPADPGFGCVNPGIVRLGAPSEIVHLPNKVILLYNGTNIWVREVPTDARALPKEDDYDGLRATGTASGRWEGDTLIIDSVDFSPDMWYGDRGWISTPGAKIVEKFRRAGDNLQYDISITDPAFAAPWIRPIVSLTLASGKAAELLLPGQACVERDGEHLPPSSR